MSTSNTTAAAAEGIVQSDGAMEEAVTVEKEVVEKVGEGFVAGEEAVFVDLPAPAGWKKKFLPKTSGTPRKNEIIFVSPTGEEMRSKKQLDQYLKSHPGCPSSSEFDWGTGDTPRRSERISKRAKAVEIVEDEPPKKKGKRSITKRRPVGKKNAQDEKTEQVHEETAAVEEKKECVDAEMKDATDDKIGKEESVTEGTIMKDSVENGNEGTKETITVGDTKPIEDVDNNSNEPEKADEEKKEHIMDQKIEENEVEQTDSKIEEKTLEEKVEDKEVTDAEEKTHEEKVDKEVTDGHEDGDISADRGCNEEVKDDHQHHEATTDANQEKVDNKTKASDKPMDGGVHSMNRDEVAAQHKASPIQC